nr:[FeFe] hydrogenase H-cluster radical SAM maturase HydE [Anaeromicropila herbilytica]
MCEHILEKDEFLMLLNSINHDTSEYLFHKARETSKNHFDTDIYIRGLIEFTNYCKNDCFYCGIRKSNSSCDRYRLSKEEILECCKVGHSLGFRTFVLQGGEDPYYTNSELVDIVSIIRSSYTDCAITLSIGEKTYDEYKELYEAGADRYLLRHETATDEHYRKLHPKSQELSNRKLCLYHLKEIGYQVGTGFMVGSPFQTNENIIEDLLFIKDLDPEMVGIGPFIPHKDTPFAKMPSGTLETTLFLIGILRLMLPNALIPATTALGTIHPKGRELGILAGANVVMPNLSPVNVRKKYTLYDNKICTGEEAAECITCLRNRIGSIGYQIVVDRGDYRS